MPNGSPTVLLHICPTFSPFLGTAFFPLCPLLACHPQHMGCMVTVSMVMVSHHILVSPAQHHILGPTSQNAGLRVLRAAANSSVCPNVDGRTSNKHSNTVGFAVFPCLKKKKKMDLRKHFRRKTARLGTDRMWKMKKKGHRAELGKQED